MGVPVPGLSPCRPLFRLTAPPPWPGGLELLELLQAAATIATAATTATAARRGLRFPRCMCAPSSWRAGARVMPTGSCVGAPVTRARAGRPWSARVVRARHGEPPRPASRAAALSPLAASLLAHPGTDLAPHPRPAP